jgi:SAM-dependent methyltransferase
VCSHERDRGVPMNLNRKLERVIKFLLDECCPPLLRDRKFFMWLPFRVAFGDKAPLFMDFKEKISGNPRGFLQEMYEKTGSVSIQEEGTDLSDSMMELVRSGISGETVLDAGCGRARLARLLSGEHRVTACDIIIDDDLVRSCPEVEFVEGAVEDLPFEDGQFDTVTCTHTLEHVWDIRKAVDELRRVACRRIIVVVPRERPYRYSFNFHLHYFLFEFQLQQLFDGRDPGASYVVRELGGCWYYHEDMT